MAPGWSTRFEETFVSRVALVLGGALAGGGVTAVVEAEIGSGTRFWFLAAASCGSWVGDEFFARSEGYFLGTISQSVDTSRGVVARCHVAGIRDGGGTVNVGSDAIVLISVSLDASSTNTFEGGERSTIARSASGGGDRFAFSVGDVANSVVARVVVNSANGVYDGTSSGRRNASRDGTEGALGRAVVGSLVAGSGGGVTPVEVAQV